MIFSHEAPIPLPLSAIHLDSWLFNLSEAEYKTCARGHRAAVGSNCAMAGALLVQHYRTELLQADHVKLYSAASRGYLMHVIPFTLKVGWEMTVLGTSPTESKLLCTIDVRNPLWIRFVGFFNATNYWVKRHLIEETQGFARDITAKVGGARAQPGSSAFAAP